MKWLVPQMMAVCACGMLCVAVSCVSGGGGGGGTQIGHFLPGSWRRPASPLSPIPPSPLPPPPPLYLPSVSAGAELTQARGPRPLGLLLGVTPSCDPYLDYLKESILLLFFKKQVV